jgi:hypothetical protein
MPSMRTWDAIRCLSNLQIFVPDLTIRWSLSRKHTLGTLNFHRSVPQPAPPTSLPQSEMVRMEVLRATYVEESVVGLPVREKMA